jgi:hypothetical protein
MPRLEGKSSILLLLDGEEEALVVDDSAIFKAQQIMKREFEL